MNCRNKPASPAAAPEEVTLPSQPRAPARGLSALSSLPTAPPAFLSTSWLPGWAAPPPRRERSNTKQQLALRLRARAALGAAVSTRDDGASQSLQHRDLRLRTPSMGSQEAGAALGARRTSAPVVVGSCRWFPYGRACVRRLRRLSLQPQQQRLRWFATPLLFSTLNCSMFPGQNNYRKGTRARGLNNKAPGKARGTKPGPTAKLKQSEEELETSQLFIRK